MSSTWHTVIIILTSFAVAQVIIGQTTQPPHDVASHSIGNIELNLENRGRFFVDTGFYDPFTGRRVWNCTYPAKSGNAFTDYAALAVGAVVDRETLVTEAEFLPDDVPDQRFRFETIDNSSTWYRETARSELDAVCSYNDSVSDPSLLFQRGHIPIYIRVKQRSMSWSAPTIDDFVLFDCTIESISQKQISSIWLGLHWHINAWHQPTNGPRGASVVGYREFSDSLPCSMNQSIAIAYGIDADGNPSGSRWTEESILGGVGVQILRGVPEEGAINFNWMEGPVPSVWWGPRKRGTPDDPFRPTLGNDVGFVSSHEDVYYLLSHREVDYEQLWGAIDHTSSGFLPPTNNSLISSYGGAPSVWLSCGSHTLNPGQQVRFTFAIVGGENVHVNPTDFADYWDPYNPGVYYSKLDFTELMTNARWAKWVYDNPGVDSDGDGYFGKFRVCDGDTNWYEGDGVPDFRADIPPPSPKLKVIPSLNTLVLRWNGYYSENAIDPFTKIKDFEGYRVYWGLDDRKSSFSTLITWDYPNFNRYFLREKPNHTFAWETKDLPFTIDSLRVLYGDSFYPLIYTKDNPAACRRYDVLVSSGGF
jgi:hypothetical protein